MRRLGFAVVLSGAMLLAARSSAPALSQCVKDAQANHVACVAQCQDDFSSARLLCRNIDPACGLPCLAGRQACFDNVETIKSTGILPGGSVLCSTTDAGGTVFTGTNGCQTVLTEAKQSCGAPCPTPTPSSTGGETACQQCVDQAQVVDLECRDTCRDAFRTNTTVQAMQKSCRDGFKACVHQCGPAPTPTPGA
jgi:hypothetical protein